MFLEHGHRSYLKWPFIKCLPARMYIPANVHTEVSTDGARIALGLKRDGEGDKAERERGRGKEQYTLDNYSKAPQW